MNIPTIVSAAMLFGAAIANWPYGYYQLLRFIVSATSGFIAFKAGEEKRQAWLWVMVGTAILFNPLVPITFSRAQWEPVDFVVGILFGVASWAFRSRPASSARV